MGTTTNSGIPAIKTRIGTRGWRARRRTSRVLGNLVVAGLALSVPVGATMLASKVRTGSALTGFDAMAKALGLRPRKRTGPLVALAGAGILAAGLLVVVGLGMRPVLVRMPG